MTDQALVLIVGTLGFVLNIVVLSIGGTWKLSRVEASIRQSVSDHRKEIDTEIMGVRKDFSDDLTVMRREFGETGAAIRAKINEVELFMRDEFVRKRSFEAVLNEVRGDIKGMGDKLEARLLRMEGKIDRAASNERE